jgi:hypothetical protein
MERRIAALTGMIVGGAIGPLVGLFFRWLIQGPSRPGPEYNYIGDIETPFIALSGLLACGILGAILGWSVSASEGEELIPDWLKMVMLGLVISLPLAGILAYFLSRL